jgi:PAX-interacting protein 1
MPKLAPQDRTFYLTPSVEPNWKQLKLVIENSGGTVENVRRRSVEQIREANGGKADPRYIIITCEQDLHLVTDVLKAKMGIYSTEFIMSAVLCGTMNFDLGEYVATI